MLSRTSEVFLDYPITQQNKPMLFEDANLDYLFKDIHGFSKNWDLVFRCMMLRRYGGYRLGTRSPARFKLWLEDKFYSLWQKYSRLYTSQDVFTNPFINMMLADEKNGSNVNRRENWATHHERTDSNAINASTHTGQGSTQEDKAAQQYERARQFDRKDSNAVNVKTDTGQTASQADKANSGFGKGRAQGVNNASSATATSGKESSSDTDLERFADTPQSPYAVGLPSKNDDGTASDNWNMDYITTATLDYKYHYAQNQGNSGTDSVAQSDSLTDNVSGAWENQIGKTYDYKTGQAKDTGQAQDNALEMKAGGNTEAQVGKSYEYKTGQLHDTAQEQMTSADEQESADGRRFAEGSVKQGIVGMSLSAMLMEWRETFAPIDDMFLREFDNLFYGVLDYNE